MFQRSPHPLPARAVIGRRQPPALVPRRTSSRSDDDTEGTCSPSEAREIETRVLLNTASAPFVCAARLPSNSETSTLCSPLESSATLPGAAEVRISALSGALIGAVKGALASG